jgi:hypothetical protein
MFGRFTLKHCIECVNCSVVVRIDTEEQFKQLANEAMRITQFAPKKPKEYPAFWFSSNRMVDRTWVNQHSFDVVKFDDIEWNLDEDIYTLVNKGLKLLSDESKLKILNQIEELLKEERKQ